MDFKMALCRPYWEKYKIDTEFIIKKLDELKGNRSFFEDVFLKDNIWQKDSFKTKTHLRFNNSAEDQKTKQNKREKFCIPIFKLTLSDDEKGEDFSVHYSVTDENSKMIELKKWRGDKEGSVWYFAEFNKKNPIGCLYPGYVDIIIRETNKKDIIKKLWICPSSLNKPRFEQMFIDISNVPYKVLQLKRDEAKSYLGVNKLRSWEHDLKHIQSVIKELDYWLNKIANSPRGRLRNSKQTVLFSKIKKFNASVVMQYLNNRSKRYYLVDSFEHSLDIYEHRVFCNRLNSLKEKVQNLNEDYRKSKNGCIEDIDKYKQDGETEQTIEAKEKQNDRIRKTINDATQKEEFIVGQINKYLGYLPFKGIKEKNEEWRVTQILTNDSRYHRVYQLLKSVDPITTLPSVNDWKKLFINKTDKIYEVWILSKIIALLERQHWVLKNDETTDNDISRIFDCFRRMNVGNDQEWVLSGKLIHKNACLEMDFYYNLPIGESLKDLLCITNENINEEKDSTSNWDLRPDFLFRIRKTKEPEKEKIFILDAKYRDYNSQSSLPFTKREASNKMNNNNSSIDDISEMYWLYKDVETVAYEKYIYRIKRETGLDVTASFIVHTDETKVNEKIFNNSSKEYMGRFVTYNATADHKWNHFLEQNDLRELYLREERDNLSYIREKTSKKKMFYKDNKDYKPETINALWHQIGSFYMVPEVEGTELNRNESEKNLQTFFAMIFEYYMEATNICWSCGSLGTVLKSKDKGTINEYWCEKCKHYWQDTHCTGDQNHGLEKHRLVKHWDNFNNYHIITKVSPIESNNDNGKERVMKYAICPVCKI